MDQWSASGIQPGQFTGDTGVQALSQDELEPMRPAWTRTDIFKKTVAIEGGIGMHLLKRMGWSEGQGLGSNNQGIVEPIMPVLKFDTKGLKTEEETNPKNIAQQMHLFDPTNVRQTHPVINLQEHCQRRRMPPPEYVMVEACGPAHKPCFVMKVNVGGVWYQPTISAPNKKQAKVMAASVACQAKGLLPPEAMEGCPLPPPPPPQPPHLQQSVPYRVP